MNPLSTMVSDHLQDQPRLYDRSGQAVRDQQAAKTPYVVREPEQEEPTGSDDTSAGDNFNTEDRWLPRSQEQAGEGGAYSKESLLSNKQLQQGAEPADARGLTPDEADQVERLRQRDSEVRRHEQAHSGALGAYAGAVSYTYQIGPDGRSYAVGGSTEVRPPSGSDAEQKAAWGRVVKNAAFAAGDASAADVAVAADATRAQMTTHPGFSVIA